MGSFFFAYGVRRTFRYVVRCTGALQGVRMRCLPFCEMGSRCTPFCEMGSMFRYAMRCRVYGCVVCHFAKWVRFAVRRFGLGLVHGVAFASALRRFATLYRVPVRRTVYGYVVRRFAKWVRFSSPTAYGYAVRSYGVLRHRCAAAPLRWRCTVHRCAARCTDALYAVLRNGFVFLRLSCFRRGLSRLRSRLRRVLLRCTVYRYAVRCTDTSYAVLRNGFVFLRLRRTAYGYAVRSYGVLRHRCATVCRTRLRPRFLRSQLALSVVIDVS